MKNLLLLSALTVILASGCKENKKAELRFCADVVAQNPCVGEDTVFNLGTKVWAQLFLPEGYADTAVVGNLFGYPEGFKVFIETKVHTLSKGQTIVMEPIFSIRCGKFEVEFLDTQGNLLDSRLFRIR